MQIQLVSGALPTQATVHFSGIFRLCRINVFASLVHKPF